ncbi:unnamed protein product [Urochloa decumbens]|uniref:F-box/LRR-repeat protein 15/At3g58940/PEG3-like LRR domain-containing protein n=1 Tax=Urochloa decumbens TaxID=240449 RepID=A0ABC9FL88_9POAL
MGVVTRAKKRSLEEVDRISGLPDGVLGDIVTLLRTKDGARTQVLSSRWRHIWRSATLNVQLHDEPWQGTRIDDVSRVLSSHPGPCRRFSLNIRDEKGYDDDATLDGWLRSPALHDLQELEIHFYLSWGTRSQQLPASAFRFSPTLLVASFQSCIFPEIGRSNSWSILKQLTLCSVTISEASLHTLLATGCPGLQSLLLLDNYFCPRYRISSPSLRSIGVCSNFGYEGGDETDDDDDDPVLLQIVIEDAPCLERFLINQGVVMDISVISAPRLAVLGQIQLQGNRRMIRFGNGGLHYQAVVPSVRVLALYYVRPCMVIEFIKCFPSLETLHVEITTDGAQYESYNEYWKLTGTLDIRLRKIVVLKYRHDYKEYIDFAKFLVTNASVLELMTLELKDGEVGDNAWITRQHSQLKIEERASRGARFDFVSCVESSSGRFLPEKLWKLVHDLSIHDPFQRIH